MLNPISERIKTIGRWTKRIARAVVYGVGLIVITAMTGIAIYKSYHASPPLTQKQAAILHEFRVQTTELEHRTQVCNEKIDSMDPENESPAAFHCAQMWIQMTKLQSFIERMHIASSTIVPVFESTIRTAGRYAEYQMALNDPAFRVSPHYPNSEGR